MEEVYDATEKTLKNIKAALLHEEEAVSMYKKFAEECIEPHYKKMFEQFAKNEYWHTLALKEKIDAIEEERGRLENESNIV